MSDSFKKSGVWQFYQDGEWRVGTNSHNHRENTEAAGMPTRDLYTHPHPEGDGWIKCSERLPTEADADYDDCVWACWFDKYDKRWRVDREHIKSDDYEYFAWKPTGLNRPQPPKEGE